MVCRWVSCSEKQMLSEAAGAQESSGCVTLRKSTRSALGIRLQRPATFS